MDKIKLICVTPNNNNKYYLMEDLGNGYFNVEYGRVGGAPAHTSYSISQWDKKYNEKIRKGYIDVSEMISSDIKKSQLNIEDADVKELIQYLMDCSKQKIKSDYEVSIDSITDIQINKVQQLIDELSQEKDLDKDKINEKLRIIYTTIPRKMGNTQDYFIYSNTNLKSRITNLLIEEQKRLNNVKTQVNINNQTKSLPDITLDSLGFSCRLATQEERDYIAKNTDFEVKNQKIFSISNKETESVFNPNKLKTKLLYHGSRNENFLSILQTGLKIRPKGVQTTGSMFGDGIYAANKARKSIGYTSLRGSYWACGSSNRGYLAIFEFATGKEYPVLDNQSWSSWMGSLNEQKVKDKGYDSVFAKGGADLRNDEYVVYNSNQCTIRYLIELRG